VIRFPFIARLSETVKEPSVAPIFIYLASHSPADKIDNEFD
jgi:hypothetical protein